MLFAEIFDVARTWATGNLPITVGGGVALLVLVLLTVIAVFRRCEIDPPKLANVITNEKAMSWEPTDRSYADRRGAVRREGQPVRVLLTSTTFRNGTGDGYVIDRSTCGLKLATQSAVPPGTAVQVRVLEAPDTIGFVTVLVRSCRTNDDYYELGCEFERTPPWNVLLLFG